MTLEGIINQQLYNSVNHFRAEFLLVRVSITLHLLDTCKQCHLTYPTPRQNFEVNLRPTISNRAVSILFFFYFLLPLPFILFNLSDETIRLYLCICRLL